ncbi:MAG TPA: hypothetical protein VG293_08550 [Solirubrobacteraceae bacterium]|jgi:hypothetical protein|nr:hypothetical protein [Solirubrobacteraceae bacterium]
MYIPREPELAELVIADPPDSWRELGFEVDEKGHLDIGGVRIRLGGGGAGITAWSLMRVNAMGSIDGLPSPVPRVLYPPPFKTHPNGATGIDHVVIVSSSLDRTAAALARAGIELKRIQEAERGRMGFRRLGPAILEVVQRDELESDEASFWGLVVVVIDIDSLAERLGDRLGPIKQAIQPGRRIAALRGGAGISAPLAFMSPEPP